MIMASTGLIKYTFRSLYAWYWILGLLYCVTEAIILHGLFVTLFIFYLHAASHTGFHGNKIFTFFPPLPVFSDFTSEIDCGSLNSRFSFKKNIVCLWKNCDFATCFEPIPFLSKENKICIAWISLKFVLMKNVLKLPFCKFNFIHLSISDAFTLLSEVHTTVLSFFAFHTMLFQVLYIYVVRMKCGVWSFKDFAEVGCCILLVFTDALLIVVLPLPWNGGGI